MHLVRPPADVRALLAVQRAASRTPAGGAPLVSACRALGRAGDHAAAWVVLGAGGAVVDPARRRAWLRATGVVLAAHAASVVLKRVARRHRPTHDLVVVHATSPSAWTFPSSHATSTTAAALAFGPLLGSRWLLPVAAAMGASRVVLGVHHPSDVVAGTALGAAVALAAREAPCC